MSDKGLIPHDPDYATPPGWIIEDHMEAFNVGKDKLAGHLGLEPTELERLLTGKIPVTRDMAEALEILFKRPA